MICIAKKFTMQMLEERAIWSVLKNHHSGERLVLLTITNKIKEIFVVQPRHGINLGRKSKSKRRN